MRGLQIAQELEKNGYDVKARVGPSLTALRDIRDSVVICIKSRPIFPGRLRKRNNLVVFDALDYVNMFGTPSHIDAIIASSDYMKKVFRSKVPERVKVKTIYHHSDPRIQPHSAGEKELKLVYVGERESSRFIRGEISELNVVPFKDKNVEWWEDLRGYNVHFSSRREMTKSVVKLANASAYRAGFLTGAEPGCEELLGVDYPYFIKNPHSLESVREGIEFVKDSIGTLVWKEARDRIESVRGQLTVQASARVYKELIHEIS